MTKREAQRRLDAVDLELKELYHQIREKEAERDSYDRIANGEARSLDISIGDYS